MSPRPSTEPDAPSGERMGKAASWLGESFWRKLTCAARETSQDSNIPVSAAPRIDTKAFFGAHFSSTSATTMPYDEANNASRGDPAAWSRPRKAGAHPVRASENRTREAAYSAAFAPDNAAVRITKVMMCGAAGI